MKRKEICNELKEELEWLDDYDKDHFSNLIEINPSDAIIKTPQIYCITALLEKIVEYSNIGFLLEKEELNLEDMALEYCYYGESLIQKLQNISTLSNELITVLQEENISHPVISMQNYLDYGNVTKEMMMSDVNIILEDSEIKKKNEILEILGEIEYRTTFHYETYYQTDIIPRLQSAFTRKDIEDVGNILAKYAKKCMILDFGKESDTSYYFSLLAQLLYHQQKGKKSIELKQKLQDIDQLYLELKFYQYKYFENEIALDIYKEKCKKL